MSLDQISILFFLAMVAAKDLIIETYVVGMLAFIPLIPVLLERKYSK